VSRFLLLLLVLGGLAGQAQAHMLNMTRATLTIKADGELVLDLQVDLQNSLVGAETYYNISHLKRPLDNPQLSQVLDQMIPAIQIQADGQVLLWKLEQLQMPQQPRADFINMMSWPRSQIRLVSQLPAGSNTLRGKFSGQYYFEEPIALTFTSTDGKDSMSRWIVNRQASPDYSLTGVVTQAPPAIWPTVAEYLRLGFKHILPQGYDHLLFVLGLLLASLSLRSLLGQITLFTLAHSITLITAAMGLYKIPTGFVEPMIALSIVWVGIENLWSKSPGVGRYSLIFMFGLLHGMGFASALAEQGLPAYGALLSLFSFNVGVELGQLSFILLCMSFWIPTREKSWYRAGILMPGSVVIALVAAVWAVQRLS